MPAGPYPTAFDAPAVYPTTSRNQQRPSNLPPANQPSSTDSPGTTSASYTPERPPSPAPSYHTLPPNTHTTAAPNTTLPTTTPLLTAARTTPDAILSHLTITNHITPVPPHARTHVSGFSSRSLSASTADGKVRYKVVPVGSVESKVVKVLPGPGQVQEEIARVVFTSRSMRVVEWDRNAADGAGREGERVVAEVGFEELERSERLGLDGRLRVEGVDKGVGWVIVKGGDGGLDEVGGGGEAKGKGKEKEKSRFSSDEHDRRRWRAGFKALRLVDREGNVYAEYRNEVGVPAPHKEESWGLVSVRSRAVLLDEGVDRAFVTLAALLECYIKLFGHYQRESRAWGNFTGSMAACNVM